MHDIIIIGGGPAGMTAAIYALRAGKTVLVLEKNGFGGQITFSPKVENYPTVLSASGNELADRMLDQMMELGAQIEIETVTGVRDGGAVKTVLTEDGAEYEARAVIIAVGVKHRMLGVPGEAELVGSGISFCAVCDGAFYKGRHVAVIGGGNSALQEAILLSEICSEVTVVQDLPKFTGEAKLVETLLSRENVKSFTGTHIDRFTMSGEELTGVDFTLTETGESAHIDCDGVFLAVGLIPENDAFENLLPLDGRGYASVGEDCFAGVPGVYAAGDCRAKSVRQLTTAVADGACAALGACRYLES